MYYWKKIPENIPVKKYLKSVLTFAKSMELFEYYF